MRRSALASVLLAAMVSAACASGTASAPGTPTRNPNLLSQAELESAAMSNRTLYDAIAQLRPTWLSSRGTTTFRDGAAVEILPAVMLDNVRQAGATIDQLRQLRVQDLVQAQLLSSSEATTMYGTGYPNGLIKITSRPGR